jgi:hypothetical protein
MKKCFLFAAAVTVVSAAAGQGSKDSAKTAAPEFMNHVYYSDGGNKLIVLEKAEAEMKTKMKLGGFGGSNTSYIMTGDRSPMRIPQNKKAEFTIKTAGGSTMAGFGINPADMFYLYKFETKGDTRVYVMQKMGAMGTGVKENSRGIKFNVKEISPGTFVMVPEKPLEPGEYGFLNMMDSRSSPDDYKNIKYAVFAFAIDK